jgi:hypothetical protein
MGAHRATGQNGKRRGSSRGHFSTLVHATPLRKSVHPSGSTLGQQCSAECTPQFPLGQHNVPRLRPSEGRAGGSTSITDSAKLPLLYKTTWLTDERQCGPLICLRESRRWALPQVPFGLQVRVESEGGWKVWGKENYISIRLPEMISTSPFHSSLVCSMKWQTLVTAECINRT